MPDDPILDRDLPKNLDAERAVLGAIIIDNAATNITADILKPEDFYRDAHRRIYQRILDLTEKNAPIDYVSLREALVQTGELDVVGGPAYLAGLADGVPRSTNVEYYAQIVKEKATARAVIVVANLILSDAFEGSEPSGLLTRSEGSIFDLSDARSRVGFTFADALSDEANTALQGAISDRRLVRGVATGYAYLDVLTSGLQRGDLVILAARPSVGKTALAVNIATYVGLRQQVAGIFSLEMSKEQLFLRMLSAEARVDGNRLRTGFLREAEIGRVTDALGILNTAGIAIDDTAGITVPEMRAKARRLLAERKALDLLVVDYIQLMQGTAGKYDNRTQELGVITRSLKMLAKELKVPVIALSQLSRNPEGRSDHRPQLSDLRESGSIEQDADMVLMLYREDLYKADAAPDVAELIIAKQRNGPCETVKLAFIKDRTTFLDYQEPEMSS